MSDQRTSLTFSARWIQETADGVGITAHQARPKPESPPRTFNGGGIELERP
jgi:hypothetical protein